MPEDIPFAWNHYDLWDSDLEISEVLVADLLWNLERPVWGISRGRTISPLEVIANPWEYPEHTKRVLISDLHYPIYFAPWDERLWILDGLHRLTLAVVVHKLEVVRGAEVPIPD